MDRAGDVADTAIKGLAAPFEPVGEAIRGARVGEPLQVATAEDPRGFRAPSLVQKYVPSLRTPEPPADPFAETYGGLRGLTQAAINAPRGPQAALEAGTQEIERPRTGWDTAAELTFALMTGRAGNAPIEAAVNAGKGVMRPLLRAAPRVAPELTQTARIAEEAPLTRAPGAAVDDLRPGFQADPWDVPRAEPPPGFVMEADTEAAAGANKVARETFDELLAQKQVRPPAPAKLPEGFKIQEPEVKPVLKGDETLAGPGIGQGERLQDMPAAAKRSGEAGGAFMTSETSQPPRTQALPSQVSAKTEVPSDTARTMAPSTIPGASTTSSLGSIEPSSNRLITQETAEVNGLLRQARESEPILTERLNNLVREVPGTQFIGARTKQAERLAEKLGSRPANTVTDYLGARIAVDKTDDAEKVIEAMKRQGLEVIEPLRDNFFEAPRSGYRAYHVQVKTPNGITAEVQIIPKEIAEVQSQAHKAYDVFRSPKVGLAEYQAAKAKSQEIFDKAWERYLARTKGAPVAGEATSVPIQNIATDPERFQPRKGINQEKVESLAESMKEKGFTKPMELWRDPKDGELYVLAGHHRLEAAKDLGMQDARAIIHEGIPEEKAIQIAMDSNKGKAPTAVAPGAAAKAPAAQKKLSDLLAELGEDLAAPLKNEKGAIGNLGEVDEARNARIKANLDELVRRAKEEGYETADEISEFLTKNGMKGSQIQVLMRQLREGVTVAAPQVVEDVAERPPKPVLGGGRRPPTEPPSFTVIPPSGGDPFEKYAGNINLQNLSLDDAAKQIIKDTAKRDAPILDKARRGTITLEQTQEMAKELGLSDAEVLKMKKGTALNAEELTAARTQLATYTKEVQNIASKIGKGGDATTDLIRLNQAIQKQAAIQRVISGVTAEAGRALSSMRIMVSPENLGAKNMEAMLEALGGREANIEMAKRLASIDPTDTAAVNAFIRSVSQPSFWDKVHEVWINAILSNPITHKVNLTSNLAFSLSRLPEKALTGLADAGIGLFTGKRGVYTRELIPETMGLFRGIGEGVRRMLYVLKNGESIESMSKLERGGQEAIKGLKGKIIRGPGTALVAEDEFAKGVNSVMSRSALATRQALSEGLSGKDLVARISELEARPTPEMLEAMEKEMLYYTFQTPFGPYGQKINGIRRIPGVRYIFPFLRTPLNIAKAGFERSPFGMAGLIPAARRGELTQAQVSQALARSAIGSSIAGSLAYWTLRGNVTGRPPKEAGKRDAWYADGKIPYGIKVGNKWRSYQIEPFGAPVGALVDTIQDAVEKKRDINYEIAAYYAGNYAKAMLQRSFLQGISNMFDALSDPERYADKQIAGFGSSAIPFSGTLRFITQSIDPIQRQSETFADGLMATIPGLSTRVPAKLDAFGEPIERPQRAYERLLTVQPGGESKVKNDPVRKMMADVDYQLNFPAKSLNKRPLTDAEFNELLSISGAEIRQNFEALAAGGAYQEYDPKEIRTLMQRFVTEARERARLLVEPKVEMRHLGVKAKLSQMELEDLGLFMSLPAYSKLESDQEKKEQILEFVNQAKEEATSVDR